MYDSKTPNTDLNSLFSPELLSIESWAVDGVEGQFASRRQERRWLGEESVIIGLHLDCLDQHWVASVLVWLQDWGGVKGGKKSIACNGWGDALWETMNRLTKYNIFWCINSKPKLLRCEKKIKLNNLDGGILTMKVLRMFDAKGQQQHIAYIWCTYCKSKTTTLCA